MRNVIPLFTLKPEPEPGEPLCLWADPVVPKMLDARDGHVIAEVGIPEYAWPVFSRLLNHHDPLVQAMVVKALEVLLDRPEHFLEIDENGNVRLGRAL
jgi:hypothetical protein